MQSESTDLAQSVEEDQRHLKQVIVDAKVDIDHLLEMSQRMADAKAESRREIEECLSLISTKQQGFEMQNKEDEVHFEKGIMETQREIDRMHQELEERKRSISTLREQSFDKQRDIDDLRGSILHATQRLGVLMKSVEGEKETVATLKEELASFSREQQATASKLESGAAEAQANLTDTLSELAKVTGDENRLVVQKELLQKENKAKNSKICMAKAEYSSKLKSLRNKIKEMLVVDEKDKGAIKALEGELALLGLQSTEFIVNQQAQDMVHADAKRQLAEQKRTVDQLNSEKTKLEADTREVDSETEQKVLMGKVEIEEIELAIKVLSDKALEVTTKQAAVRAANEVFNDQKLELEQSAAEFELQLQASRDRRCAIAAAHKSAVEEDQKRIKEVEGKVEAASKENDNAARANAEIRASMDECLQRIDLLRTAELSTLSDDLRAELLPPTTIAAIKALIEEETKNQERDETELDKKIATSKLSLEMFRDGKDKVQAANQGQFATQLAKIVNTMEADALFIKEAELRSLIAEKEHAESKSLCEKLEELEQATDEFDAQARTDKEEIEVLRNKILQLDAKTALAEAQKASSAAHEEKKARVDTEKGAAAVQENARVDDDNEVATAAAAAEKRKAAKAVALLKQKKTKKVSSSATADLTMSSSGAGEDGENDNAGSQQAITNKTTMTQKQRLQKKPSSTGASKHGDCSEVAAPEDAFGEDSLFTEFDGDYFKTDQQQETRVPKKASGSSSVGPHLIQEEDDDKGKKGAAAEAAAKRAAKKAKKEAKKDKSALLSLPVLVPLDERIAPANKSRALKSSGKPSKLTSEPRGVSRSRSPPMASAEKASKKTTSKPKCSDWLFGSDDDGFSF